MPYLAAGTALMSACVRMTPTPAASPVDLVIASTTDVHGRLRGWDYYLDAADTVRGLARAATIVDSVRAANPGRVVLVDAGDLLQGNPLAYVAARVDSNRPHVVVAAMNAMNYDAATIGNHEFNYGLPTLERAVREAKFPFLATNAYTPDGKHAFRGWTMVERAGVRVAIIGATTPGSMLWDRDNLRGRLVIRDVVPEVRAAVREARNAGADVVVVSIHGGLNEPSSYDTVSTGVGSENPSARVAHEVRGIDVIVYGHSHRQMADTIIDGTLLVQPKNWASSVSVVHLQVERTGGAARVVARSGVLIPTIGHRESPTVLAATEEMHRATVRYATEPIGSTPVAWRADSSRVADTPLIDFILEVERKATGAQLSSTASFSLDASLDAGPVTVARLAALYPYDNTLRVIRISGAQLRAYLEHSARYYRTYGSGAPIVNDSVPGYNFDIVAGVDYTIDLSRPLGSRITTLEYQGRPVAPGDSFTFALNNYRQTGGGGYAMLADAPLIDDRQVEIRQLLIDEVRRVGTLRPQDYFHRNWQIVPAAAVGQAYAEMNRGTRMPAPAAARSGAPPRAALTGPRLRVIATNDFHGALEPRADNGGIRRGGAAWVATAIERARAECAPPDCQTVLVDAGDLFQGTPASNLSFGKPVVEAFNALGYTATALGNHDLDWGQDTLRSIMRAADFRMLGANVRDTQGRDVPWIPNDTLVQRGAYRIGIVGAALVETPEVTKASNVVGLTFVDPVPIVDSIAASLRSRGADAVILLAHIGAFCDRTGHAGCNGEIVEVARRLSGKVDAIVAGHTHSLVDATIAGIPVVQARSRGQAIDVVDVPLRGQWTAVHEVRSVTTDSLTPDPKIQAIVDREVAHVAPRISAPVAEIAENMLKEGSQFALGNLIADAMRVEGKGDVGVMNNGGIRAGLWRGTATYGSLFEIQPFGNVLYRVRVRGADLRRYFEQRVRRGAPTVHVSGATIVYDTTRPPGDRITRIRVAGTPLSDARVYRVVINDFMLGGGDSLGFGAVALSSQSADVTDLDALIAYLRSRPQPVAAPTEPRFIIRTSK